MTIEEIDSIVDVYIKHCGMRRVEGIGADPILPFFILDAMYSIMTKDIYPLDSKREMKVALNRWKAAYTAFNRDFFSAFSADEQDKVIDIMDSFQSYIGNDIVIAKISVMNLLQSYNLTLEQQKIVSSCMLCHVLAQTASIIWDAVYALKAKNPYIRSILKYSSEYMNLYFGKISKATINPNNSKEICAAMDALCKKIIKFLDTLK